MTRVDIPADLEWLAIRPWPSFAITASLDERGAGHYYDSPLAGKYTHQQYLHARHVLGLDSPVVTEEEDEAWREMEEKQASRSKYHREIKPGVWVDVYDVLHAWRVQNPALQHLIKKALQPGERGHKTMEQDMNDIVASALRAREMGGEDATR